MLFKKKKTLKIIENRKKVLGKALKVQMLISNQKFKIQNKRIGGQIFDNELKF